MDANPQAIHDLKPPYSNSISAEDVLRNTASELGDIAQDANALVARVALTCKQPALAAQVKECFSRLMAMNAEQGRALAHTVDPSAVEAAHDAARACGRHQSVNVCRSMLRSSDPAERDQGVLLFEDIVANLASGTLDVGQSVTPAAPETINWSSETPGDWSTARRDRDVLLALVRGYRFLTEACSTQLADVGLTRFQLMRKLRGVELKAILEGVAV